MSFHETDNLRLDDEGDLHVKCDDEWDRLGSIDDVKGEAEELGLAGEFSEHLDLWRDYHRGDYAGQVRHDYRSTKGF